jgi:hypothetical protein
VLEEFYVTVTRKTGSPLRATTAREVVRDYAVWAESSLTAATIVRASEISEVWQISFWDAMILAAAETKRRRTIVDRGPECRPKDCRNRDSQPVFRRLAVRFDLGECARP